MMDDLEEAAQMKDEYDFSSGRRNPYSGRLKTQTTLRLDQNVIEYFKRLGGRIGIPYQTLINMYLSDCVARRVEPEISWLPAT